MNRYYLDFEMSTLWLRANNGSLVCIAAKPADNHELGCVISKPILPGHWVPFEGGINFSAIVLSKIKPAVY